MTNRMLSYDETKALRDWHRSQQKELEVKAKEHSRAADQLDRELMPRTETVIGARCA